MKEVFRYIIDYVRAQNIIVFTACSLLTAVMIYLNFHYSIDYKIEDNSIPVSFLYRYIIFLIAFAMPYFFYVFQQKNYFKHRLIFLLILLSPAIFSWKMVMRTQLHLSDNYQWDYYWNQVIYWPMRLIAVFFILFFIWKSFYKNESFFGLTIKNFEWKPYLIML